MLCSKVRHLISSLERENISLAHVWPKTYCGATESTAKTTCYWFVGLLVGGSAGAHLDLTSPIKNFTDIVMRSAIQINVWKTGMRIEAYYKKRKALSAYLPPDEHWKLKSERKSSVVINAINGGPATKRTQEETGSPQPPKRMNSGTETLVDVDAEVSNQGVETSSQNLEANSEMEDTDFSKIGAADITDTSQGLEALVS